MLNKRKSKNKKKKSHIPFRLNLLFLIVFFSFIALISRLAYVQLVKGDEFVALVQPLPKKLFLEDLSMIAKVEF